MTGDELSPRTLPPSRQTVSDLVEKVFHYRPCLWQIRIVEAILKRDKDVISISATGSGKTLTFWMPLLLVPSGIQIVVTPLNILGGQNVDSLAKVGIRSISISAETATEENFAAIADGKYRAIITNIEMLSQTNGGFSKLWANGDFMSKVISIVWDEGQCIANWKDFRKDYRTAGSLRYLIPKEVRFYLTSATLPSKLLAEVKTLLGMGSQSSHLFTRTNDRPNVHISVRKMRYPISSFDDLAFLVPPGWDGVSPLPYKFVIFFDNIDESIRAGEYLRARLPPGRENEIVWFNSEMSGNFREDEAGRFRQNESIGLAASESFGLGVDLPNVTLVIQWRAGCDMCTLWQRFGRGARDPSLTAIALFLVEPGYFDSTKAEQGARKAAAEAKKRDAAVTARRKKKQRLAQPEAAITTSHHTPSSHDNAQLPEASGAAPTMSEHPSHLAPSLQSIQHAPPIPEYPSAGLDKNVEDNDSDTGDNAGNLSDGNLAGDEGWDELHEELCHKSNPASVHKGKAARGLRQIDPFMDNLINAGAKDRKFKCFRHPITLYFDNDLSVSSHVECRPDLVGGCPRCVTRTSAICCELCNPEHFANFAQLEVTRKLAALPRSRIPKYKPDPRDDGLRRALHKYRKVETANMYGESLLKSEGPGIFMATAVMHRIVDCAHFYKIIDSATLSRETRWVHASSHCDGVLALINLHCPKPAATGPLTSAPRQSSNIASNGSAPQPTAAKPRKKNQCSKCGSHTHNAKNRICPANARVQDKENLPPLQ